MTSLTTFVSSNGADRRLWASSHSSTKGIARNSSATCRRASLMARLNGLVVALGLEEGPLRDGDQRPDVEKVLELAVEHRRRRRFPEPLAHEAGDT